ncbi:MAG: CPBP family glutamic-type intramembrane protease [Coriobacteriia bacterium]|nr:CPBP family glutamic-type intramembrane protease [Coriobacteriia bacterium]
MSAERPKLVLHPVDCDGCGRCAEACRRSAIRLGPNYIYVDWSRCDGCGKCADLCDRDAIEVRDSAGAATRTKPDARALGGLELGAGADPAAGKRRLWRPRIGLPGAGKTAQEAVPETAPAVEWSLREAVVVLVVAVVLQVFMQMALGSTLVRSLTDNGIMLARGTVLALYYSAQICMLLLLALRRDVGFLEAFRLDAPPDFLSIPLGLSMLVVTWSFSMLFRAAAIAAGWKPPASDSPSLTQLFGADALGMTVTVVVVVLLAPIVEELIVRGIVLGALGQRLGRWWAIALSALMFATLHGSLWSFVPMTFLGLALGRIASWRRSLWPAIILHVAYNAVIVAPAFLVAAGG